MRPQGRSIRRVSVITATVALMLPLLAAEARATSTWYINSNTTLTEDHTGGIVVDADNVTLDCAGWRVIGTNDSDGIVIDGHSGVAVKNCVVQQFVYGIVVRNASAGLLEHNEVRWNGLSGIDVCCGSVDIVVRQNTMHENGFDAGYSGIDVEYGSSDVVVSGNTSWGNASNGFYIYQSSNLLFDNNDAFSNHSQGFDLDLEATDSIFSNNRTFNNWGNGITSVASDGNRFIANDVSGNGGIGIRLHRSSGNVVRSNDVRGNSADGISLDTESTYNVIRDNDVEWNDFTGIPVTGGSDWNLLVGNVSSHNGDGIRIETSHNTLLSNRADDNANYGFWVTGSYNRFALNSGCGNGILDALQEEGTKGNVWLANNFCTSDI